MTITLYQHETRLPDAVILPADDAPDHYGRRFFHLYDFQTARDAVLNGIKSKAGFRTPEQHTFHKYRRILDNIFIPYLIRRGALPTATLLQEFIVDLQQQDDIKSAKTINTYLAPIRAFCIEVADQLISYSSLTDPRQMFELQNVQLMMRKAGRTKGLDIADQGEADLDAHGKWLTMSEVQEIIDHILTDTSELRRLRNLAIFMLGFQTGLRRAEILRVTINSINRSGTTWRIRVRGKRKKMTPVALPVQVGRVLLRYIEKYNEGLPLDDPRRIGPDDPIFRPLTRNGNRYNCQVGTIKPRSLHQIVTSVSGSVRNGELKISTHDMRRTFAAIGRSLLKDGFKTEYIKRQLRHDNLATTETYVGQEEDYDEFNITNYGWQINTDLPSAA